MFGEWTSVEILILEQVLVVNFDAVYLIPFGKLVLPLREVVLPANNQHFLVCILSIGVVVG